MLAVLTFFRSLTIWISLTDWSHSETDSYSGLFRNGMDGSMGHRETRRDPHNG